MDLLILITYFSICWVIFRIFNISINTWSITTVVLGALIILGTMLSIVSYFHPASVTARSYFITTPIIPNVKGTVVEVNVQANKDLKKGDVLFKIDPVPFQAKVDQLKSELSFAKKRLAQSRKLVKVSAGSKYDVEKYEKDVATTRSKLVDAKFDLESTIVRAPTDGFVTHLRLRPGMMATTLPFAPLMTFIHTKKTNYFGGFTQQPMQNIKVGNNAEIFFPGIPGRVFKAKVVNIMDAIAEGQLSPSATMISVNPRIQEGLVPVEIEITDDISGFYLPMGSAATIAIYSEDFHHISIVRKILIRMMSWKNYVRLH
ncbi:HlyD family secretion protein [Poseidonibacter lekithochrous]|uniref:HlyD family secretion protein n=1 Tax=Poseidonibacter lekithochrous TaxID=1904463 RepID=UPI000D3B1F8A|nr:biotin/lipoyl-binding protein [Poseidonibacter lekithochrous]